MADNATGICALKPPIVVQTCQSVSRQSEPTVAGSIGVATRNERISELESKLKALKSEANRVAARQRTVDARRERTKDTRRKILLGAWVMRQIERGELSREAIARALESYLERDDDRALFDLPARAAAPASPSAVVNAGASPPLAPASARANLAGVAGSSACAGASTAGAQPRE